MYDMYFDFSFYQQHVVNWAFSPLRSLTLGQDSRLRNHPAGSAKTTVGCCFILVSTIWNYTQIYIMKHMNMIAQTKSAGPTCSALWFSALSILSLCDVEWWEYDIEHISLCLTGWPSGQRKASGAGGKHLVHLILWQISLKMRVCLQYITVLERSLVAQTDSSSCVHLPLPLSASQTDSFSWMEEVMNMTFLTRNVDIVE